MSGRERDQYLELGEHETNGRATVADPVAARELELYISNDYSLVGAPNSIAKSIDSNLRRKVAKGTYSSSLAPKAWQHLIDEGAKRYEREFGSGSPIFNAATRRQVAADFASAWEEENGINSPRHLANNPAPMQPDELARYAIRESVRNTERFGLNKEGIERAYVIGRQDIRGAGGLGAVLDALGVIASDEGRTEAGYHEFWGRVGTPGQEAWRVVVIPDEEMIPNARRIPEHLQGYEDFSQKDFEDDLIDRGYYVHEARYQAARAAQQTGRTNYFPPRVPAGWKLRPDAIFNRRTAKPSFVAHKGGKFQVFDHAGKSLSGELRNMRAYFEWCDKNGYGESASW